MANYPQELAQDTVCQSHTGHMTGLWFLPARPLRLYTNEWMNYFECGQDDGRIIRKLFTALYETRMFITAFTSARHLSLSWARSIQSMPPHPTSGSFILILSSQLRLGLPRGLFPSGFPTKTLYTHLLSPMRATCPAHLILLELITRTIFGEKYRSLSSSLCKIILKRESKE